MSTDTVAKVEDVKQRITGKVKWFNNKAGFGFVTAVEGDLKDQDVFVHFSSIHVPDDQYRYLMQGEYVDFELSKSEKSEHEYHAVNISGVKGGSLMCETRNQSSTDKPYKRRVYKTPDGHESKKPVSVVVVTATSETESKKKTSKRNVPKDDDGYTKIPIRRQKTTSTVTGK